MTTTPNTTGPSRFRFRAWHKQARTMQTPTVEQFLILSSNGKIIMLTGGDIMETDEFIVMQSTGLTDKNGREIYEGDIVLWPDTESEYVNVEVGEVKVAETPVNSFGPVTFKDGAFGVESPGGETASKGWYSLKDFLYDYCPPEDIEVIGNRYENPDLLPSA